MTLRPLSALLALVLGLLAVGCGSQSGAIDGPSAPPPAQVLDATVVFFDADGNDAEPTMAPLGSITDTAKLEAFARRYVDGQPAMGRAPADALDDGLVLIGGSVSSGCFAAHGALLVLVDGDVRSIPKDLPPEDPSIACVRAVTSVALLAINPADLPAGATIQGT